MTQAPDKNRWTISDVELLATDEWKRYEIIDGELFVSRAPHIGHQYAIGSIYAKLLARCDSKSNGQPIIAPGVIFSDSDSVIPDIIWISNGRLAQVVNSEGHLTGAPELVVEVLSEGISNERRDREAKLKLYSIKGVQEYLIVDWNAQEIEVYQRQNAQLVQVSTLFINDTITSSLLPGFNCQVKQFF